TRDKKNLLCYIIQHSEKPRKISDIKLSQPTLTVIPTPIEDNLLVVFGAHLYEKSIDPLLYCRATDSLLIIQRQLGLVKSRDRDNIQVLPNGYVIFKEIDKAHNVTVKSVNLMKGHQKDFPISKSSEDFFVTQAEGFTRIGAISYEERTRRLFRLDEDECLQDQHYFDLVNTVADGLPFSLDLCRVVAKYVYDVRLFKIPRVVKASDDSGKECDVAKKCIARYGAS
ncbi:MAG: hypothetical protein ACYCQI_02335, partial [Gammaproteobacteria bacterium]